MTIARKGLRVQDEKTTKNERQARIERVRSYALPVGVTATGRKYRASKGGGERKVRTCIQRAFLDSRQSIVLASLQLAENGLALARQPARFAFYTELAL